MSTRLFRVILHVGDVDQATHIYSKLLGVPGTAVGGGRVYFDLGGTILAVMVNDDGPPQSIAEYAYFAVDDVDAVHAVAEQLDVLAGDEIHGAPGADVLVRPWGERSFYARDPWDNGLCFVDASTLFTGKR